MSATDDQYVAPKDLRSRIAAFEANSPGGQLKLMQPSVSAPKNPGNQYQSIKPPLRPNRWPEIQSTVAISASTSSSNDANGQNEARPSVKDILARYNGPSLEASSVKEKKAPPVLDPKISDITVQHSHQPAAPATTVSVAESLISGLQDCPAKSTAPHVPTRPTATAKHLDSGAKSENPSAAPVSARCPSPLSPSRTSTQVQKDAPISNAKASSTYPPVKGEKGEAEQPKLSAATGPNKLRPALPSRSGKPVVPPGPSEQKTAQPSVSSTSALSSAQAQKEPERLEAPLIPARPRTVETMATSEESASNAPSNEALPPSLPRRPPQRGPASSSKVNSDGTPPFPNRSETAFTAGPNGSSTQPRSIDVLPAPANALLPPPSRSATASSGRSFATAAPTEVKSPRSIQAHAQVSSNLSNSSLQHAGSRLDGVQWNFDIPFSQPGKSAGTTNGQRTVRKGVFEERKQPRSPLLRDPDAEAWRRYDMLFEEELERAAQMHRIRSQVAQTNSAKCAPPDGLSEEQCRGIWAKSRLSNNFIRGLWQTAVIWQQNSQLLDLEDDPAEPQRSGLKKEAFAKAMAGIDAELLDRKLSSSG